MKGKSILYILLLLVFLSATLGVVSASGNISESTFDSSFDVLGVEEDIIFEDEVLSASADVNEELNDGEVLSSSDNLNNGSDGEVLSLSEELNNELASSITYNNEDDFLGLWETVYTTDRGCDFVPLSNGYTGFCAKREMTFPTSGTPYITEQQYILTHDNTGGRVDNKLRLAIIYYADNPEFQKANAITIPRVALGSFSLLQHLIWYLSKYDTNSYSMGDLDKYPALKNAYYDIINRHENGEWIPEEGITYTYDDYQVTYEFLAFRSSSTYQTLIGYKKTITENPISYEIQKVTKTPEVMLNDQVQFELLYKNTGKRSIDNVYIVEDKWDDGLVYDSFIDENNIWTHSINNQGKHVWTLKGNLAGYSTQSLYVVFNTTKVLRPDLEVTKISLTPEVYVGEQTLFLITVINTGEVDLNNVFVVESFPDGLIYDSFTGNNWRKEGNVFYYDGVLGVGKTASFTIAFNTTVNGTFVNCVVAGSNETDKKTANNTTKVLKPGLDVSKITLTPVVLVGEQVRFEIVVRNIGETVLNNVFVEEYSYDGLVYDSFVDNGIWTHSVINGKNVWTLNKNLDLNGAASLFVNFNTTVRGNFTNVVVSGSDKTENKTTNNTTEVLRPDMEVTKVSLTPEVYVGEQTFFLITVTNTGDVDLTGVFVEETFPDGLIYDSFTGDNWSNNGNVFYYDKVLGVGESVNFTIAFNTTINGTFVNCVVAGSNETENKTTNNTTKVSKPGLEVSKITLTPVVLVGDQVRFEIVVRNIGETVLNNVFVEEYSYDGLVYDSFVDNGLWTHSLINGKNVWTLNRNLDSKELVNLFVNFNTTMRGNFTNVVVAGSDKTENKTANNTTTVLTPDLTVEKVALTPVVKIGDQVRFEIIVRNTGESVLTNVFVEESSYDGLTYDSFIDNGLWTHSLINGKNIWTLNSDLALNEVVGFFVNFKTTKEGNFTNVVVAGSKETENKTDNDTVEVLTPNISVQKITLTPIVHVGNQTSFEIIVKNTGKVVLTNVFLEETSYDGLTYDSFVDNGAWTHSIVNGKNVWTLNSDLGIREIAVLTVRFNTTVVGNFTNIVTVGSTETENKIANNTTIVYNNTVPEKEEEPTKNPDIDIEKIALNDVVILGSQVRFEIIVRNTGNVILNNVVVSEDSFEGLTYDSFIDYTGLWTKNGDLSWKLNGPLYTGEIAAFYVVFNTTAVGEFTNIVSVDSDETGNKTANDTVEVIKPDFAVEKIAINKSVLVGDQVMFEIVVHNFGQVTLNDVVVREESFEGLTYDSFIDYTGLWTKNNDLSWSLNTPLYVGEYAGFFVVFNTTSAGEFMNVIVADSKEIPNKTANDTVEVLTPGLSVQKITINRTVYVGEQVLFEIIVQNTGKVVLNNVVVSEDSFDGLTYNSFIDYNKLWIKNNDLSWTLNAPLYAGEYLSFYVVFDTTKAGNFTNIVSASSDKTDKVSANNVTEVIEKPLPKEEPKTPEPPVEPPVTPEPPTTPEPPVENPKTPEPPVTPEVVPEKNETAPPKAPEQPKKEADVLPATGNPLIMVLLALVALGGAALRRRK